MIEFVNKEDTVRINRFIDSDEIDCQCSYKTCNRTLYQESTMESFEKTRHKFSKAIRITSGYRCQMHNADVGGKVNSFHTIGAALDLQPQDGKDLNLLEDIARNFFDVVIRYRTFVHCHNLK